MERATQKATLPPEERLRWMLVFSLGGDLRFISHHDTLRLFRRALARADVPLRYTEGFNPHPKVMIPLPRPVGIASRDDALVFETFRPIDPEATQARIQEKSPQDIRVKSLRRLERSESLEPVRVRYRLDCPAEDCAALGHRVEGLLASDVLTIERKSPKTKLARVVNIRPFVEEVIASGLGVEFTLRYQDGSTARPSEIAGALGCDPDSINHRIERLEIQWKSTP